MFLSKLSTMSLKDIQYYGEWVVLRAVMRYVQRCDLQRAHERTQLIAKVMRRILRNEWRWALKNLQIVFGPSLSEEQRILLATIAFEQHLASYVEGMRVGEVSVQTVGVENVSAAYNQGRGVIVCGIHIGSWEAMVKWFGVSGFPVVAIYRRAHNPLSDREFQMARSSYGVRWLRSDDVRGVVNALQQKHVAILMADLNTTRGGVSSEVFGLPAMCPAGPAKLALRLGCPVITAVNIREDVGKTILHISPALHCGLSGSSSADIAVLTRQINQSFEPWILEYAEQYNWLHPRWRSRPNGNTWRVSDPIEPMWAERSTPFPKLNKRVEQIIHDAGKKLEFY